MDEWKWPLRWNALGTILWAVTGGPWFIVIPLAIATGAAMTWRMEEINQPNQ